MSATPILVPLDGSDTALTALPVATTLRQIVPATLRLLHVAESMPPNAELLNRLRALSQELDHATLDVRTGEPVEEILRCAEEIKPRGIVLCKHTAPAAPTTLGSTITGVLRHASCPLVLVPPERGATPWHLQHILVPHDGTPRTSVGFRPAVELAERAKAELLVLHVVDVNATPGEPGSLVPSLYMDQPQHEWPAWTSEFVQRFASLCLLGQVHLRFRLAHGNPAAEILRLATEQSADLVVLAWRGKLDPSRAAVLKELVSGAQCPVMVIRT
jgi:nucleotide-binding universal stress UspA family protein